MDYALWNNWSVRLEYDYLDFGSRTFAMNNIATGAFAENATVRLKAHEVKLGLKYLFNAANFNPIVPPTAPAKKNEPEPQRLGLPAPLDSPPFPTADWPLGGSQLIGVPDTAVGPLMKWIYDGPNGQAWKDSRVEIYGWAEVGANASTSTHSLAPTGYPIHPNRVELDQFVFRIERLPDTAHRSFGMPPHRYHNARRTAQSPPAHSPKLLAKAASAVPASMAPTALRVATIISAAVLTPSQMRGPVAQVVATTIEISTDIDMYLRNASMRGVIATYDMIQTPPTRVATVTTANRTTALIAAMASTMPPRPDDAPRHCPGNDVPARRQDIRAGDRDSRG
jgi:hypothetical protein